MAVFLSPGVFTREIDLSVLPAGVGALTPAFIGTAQKGPINEPTLITSAEQFVDTFGDPFPESYLGYAVMAYLEEGNRCFVIRVGVESQQGQPAELAPDTIDTSGAMVQGWGRIPVFTGIDNGVITLREVTANNPVVITEAGVDDQEETLSNAQGSLNFSDSSYTGETIEIYTVRITDAPDGSAPLEGAGYLVTNSGGDTIAQGSLEASNGDDNTSRDIVLESLGLTFNISLSSGELSAGDTFRFRALPDSTVLTVTVEGITNSYTLTPGIYDSNESFIGAINGVSPNDFTAIEVDGVVRLRTTQAGRWIQLAGNIGLCNAIGIAQWTFDNPRSYLLSSRNTPYNMTTQNNKIVLDVIGQNETTRFNFRTVTGTTVSAAQLASDIHANGKDGNVRFFEAMPITVPGGDQRVLITTTVHDTRLSQLELRASFTNLETLRFAEELGINFPYTRPYRGFHDPRVTLPEGDNQQDVDYRQNIVGWLIAKTPGTWVNNYTVSLNLYRGGFEEDQNRYSITVYDADGVAVDSITDISFDPSDDRYIGEVVNDGGRVAGVNGNDFYQWDQHYPEDGSVRQPSALQRAAFSGGANGIPSDPAFSSLLDSAVIGNAAFSTGIYSLQNPESFDFNLLATPGFTSGPVIAQALQFCEGRGDVLYLVDPPFGLRPQQAIDWHNGMLSSDLSAAINSSYGALYWSWIRVSDQFSGGTIWVPPSGHISAVFARTARDAEQWIAPAGLTRGRLLTALDVEYNPTLGERDALYGSGSSINPLVNFTGEGITVWGQRTLQRRATALDRVNVRMLLIFLKKNLQQLLRSFIFEPNDDVLRTQVVNTISPFLADVLARRGVTAYRVVCDETNNTPERIDRNELWVSVFVQPTRAAEFIVLNLVVLRTGANFGAQEVLAAGGVVGA